MLLIAVIYGGMRLDGFIDALVETALTSAMIFLILLGAGVLNAFLGFSRLPIWAAELFQNSGLPPYVILLGMIVLYLFLGCIMDSLAMILITIPIFWPIIAALDFGLQPGRREAVVRHHYADGGGDRADHPAGRLERVRDQFARHATSR